MKFQKKKRKIALKIVKNSIEIQIRKNLNGFLLYCSRSSEFPFEIHKIYIEIQTLPFEI